MKMLSGVAADTLHAVRLARRRPRFSSAAVVLLALVIGRATIVFTLVNAVLLLDMPFREPDRLAWMYNARTERDRAPLSIPDLEDYQRETTMLEGTYALAAGAIVCVTAVATWLPARRAARTDPAEVLRA
jgi:hypothetical protein